MRGQGSGRCKDLPVASPTLVLQKSGHLPLVARARLQDVSPKSLAKGQEQEQGQIPESQSSAASLGHCPERTLGNIPPRLAQPLCALCALSSNTSVVGSPQTSREGHMTVLH